MVSIIRCGSCANSAAEAEFVEEPQRAGVHRVAAEVAQEVGVLLHHRDVDAAAGEQQAQHHARRAAAGDQAGRRSAVAGTRHPLIVGWTG